MEGKICVVTGANSGIGYETAKTLAGKGAKTIMICRNERKGKEALAAIQQQTGNNNIELHIADLASQDQVREAAARIQERNPVIDALVNNAGIWISRRTLTVEGYETVFAVNHLAHFLLVHLLYPNLRRAADARIINVSSDAHFQAAMHFDDIHLSRNYHGLRSHTQSKLANVLFTYELHRRKTDDHISVNAVQPGLVYTDIGLKHTSWLHSLAWKVRRGLWKSMSPEEGARTSVFLASSPEIQKVSGKYWDNCQPKPSSEASYREADAAKLWKISLEMCGIKDFFG